MKYDNSARDRTSQDLAAPTNARDIAWSRGGIETSAGRWLIPCPVPSHGRGRGDRNPSCSISDGDLPGRVLVHCFGGCPGDQVIAALREAGDLGDVGRPISIARLAQGQPRCVEVQSNSAPADNRKRALGLWRGSVSIVGTAAEVYLARRSVRHLIPEDCGALHWHGDCPFAGETTGAMIALVTNIRTNEPVAVHRTALTVDGTKVVIRGHDRMTLGPIGGGAIKLTPDEDVTTCLGVGEGIETTLSLRGLPEFGLTTPVWSLVSKAGVRDLPVLAGIEVLWIAVDNDLNGGGRAAAEECAARWRAAGREVVLVQPTAAQADMNDVVREAAHV